MVHRIDWSTPENTFFYLPRFVVLVVEEGTPRALGETQAAAFSPTPSLR